MRFQITMNMPSRSGNSVHQIIADHPAESLESFVKQLSNTDFLIVQEVYKDVNRGDNYYYPAAPIALNHMYVGKVKMFGDNNGTQRNFEEGHQYSGGTR